MSRRRPVARNLVHSVGIAALIALLVASGAGATYAFWTANATAESTATGAALSVSTDFPAALPSIQNHALTINGTFTVTNGTATARAIPMTVSSQLSASMPAGYDAALQVSVWRESAASCTSAQVPTSSASGVVSGRFSTIPAAVSTVAAQQSVVHCVRVTASDRTLLGAAGGAFTLTPKVVSKLTIDGASAWVATDESTTTQSTQAIYPAKTDFNAAPWYKITDAAGANCVDVKTEANTEGQDVIGYECKPDSGSVDNQRWKLQPSGSYYRIVSKKLHNGDSRAIGLTGVGTAVVMTSATTDATLWQAQQVAAGLYQLVNKASGLCITRGVVTLDGDNKPMTAHTQQICAGSSAQTFAFTPDSPTVVPGPPQTPSPVDASGVNQNARYHVVPLAASGTCVTSANGGLGTGACTTDHNQWRFRSAGNNTYFIGMANLWGTIEGLRWQVSDNGNKAQVSLGGANATGTQRQWEAIQLQDGSYQFRNANNTRCLTLEGYSAGDSLQVMNCDANDVRQKFNLLMDGNPNLATVTLDCVSGWDNAFFWPENLRYKWEAKYRVFVGETIVATGIDGWNGFRPGLVNMSAFGLGTYAITVQQSVAGGSWTTVGSRELIIAAPLGGSMPPYQCGG